MTDNEEWDYAEQLVADGAERLRAAATYHDVRAWAKDNKIASKRLFKKVKSEMFKQYDIDYNQLYRDTIAAETADIDAAADGAPLIELFSAGDDEVGSYAIVPPGNDRDVWYSEFHEKDSLYSPGDPLTAERSAASKAIYLAGQARLKAKLDVVRLTLLCSHPDITAELMARDAISHRVALTVEHREQNPAAEWCREMGYQGWRNVRLHKLFVEETAGEVSAEAGPDGDEAVAVDDDSAVAS